MLLCEETILHIDNALYSFNYHRKLLSFKYNHLKGYHIKIRDSGDIKYLCITQHNLDKKQMCNGNATGFFLEHVLHLY